MDDKHIYCYLKKNFKQFQNGAFFCEYKIRNAVTSLQLGGLKKIKLIVCATTSGVQSDLSTLLQTFIWQICDLLLSLSLSLALCVFRYSFIKKKHKANCNLKTNKLKIHTHAMIMQYTSNGIICQKQQGTKNKTVVAIWCEMKCCRRERILCVRISVRWRVCVCAMRIAYTHTKNTNKQFTNESKRQNKTLTRRATCPLTPSHQCAVHWVRAN